MTFTNTDSELSSWNGFYRDTSFRFNPSSRVKRARMLARAEKDPCRIIFNRLARPKERQSLANLFLGACEIASKSDIRTTNLALFASNVRNRRKAEAHVNEYIDADVIHTTPAGRFLEELRLFDPDLSPLDAELAYIPIYIATLRLCQETTSPDIKAFVEEASEMSIFRMLEVAALYDNEKVQTINGIPKGDLLHLAKFMPFVAWLKHGRAAQNADDVFEGSLVQQFRRCSNFDKPVDPQEKFALKTRGIKDYILPLFPSLSPSHSQ